MNISNHIATFIKKLGLKHVFGIAGVPNLFLLNSLEKNGIKFIQNIHENNSVFFAAGYYLSTQKINFVFITAGPGLTNCVTAISNLYIDNIPTVIISINNNTFDYGLGNHHDSSSSSGIDLIQMLKSCTCYSDIVTSEKNLIGMLSKAYFSSLKNSKPSHISIPMNLLNKEIFKQYNDGFFNNNQSLLTDNTPNTKIISKIFNGFKKPLFIFSDFSRLDAQIKNFIENNKLYYCLTSSNKQIYSNDNFLGYIDYIDQLKINKSIGLFEEIVLIGNNFNNFYLENVYKKISGKKIIHFGNSVDSNIFGIYSNYYFHIINNFEDIFGTNLNNYYSNFLDPLIKKIDLKEKKDYVLDNYYIFFDYFNSFLKETDSVFISVGNTTKYGFKFFRPKKPNINIFYTGNFFALGNSISSIGYALNNKKRVYVLLGDGDFLMNWNEILTAINYKIDITLVLFNNGGYKSLKEPFESKYDINSFNDDVFNSINIGFEGIGKSLGLNYYKLDDICLIDNIFSSIPKKGVNLIEIKI